MSEKLFFNFTINFKVLFFILLTQNIQAQKGISIEPTLHFGSIVKHTKKLTYDVKRMTIGADVNLKFQTYGKKEWHQWQRFPLFGVALYYMNYGDWEILGHTFSLSPNVTVPLFKKEKWNGHFQIGTGVAYSNRKFDYLTNPTNNALGSNWNSTVAMKFYASRQIHPNYKLHLGLSLTHYSNGAARLPNFGINVPALMVGLNYTPQPLRPDDYIFHEKSSKPKRRFGVDAQRGVGFVEVMVIDGPRYPIYNNSLAVAYYLNKVNRLLVGLEYEMNGGVYAFSLHSYHALSREEARKMASRLAVFAADEFRFGDWSITVQLSFYLGNFSFLLPLPYYSKLTTRYYLPIPKFKNHVFVGMTLKAHAIRAEYIAFGGGIAF